jgi:hypothetical protein
MHRTDRQHLPKSDLRWLHLDRINHLHETLSVQQALDKDLSIVTCGAGVTPFDHSIDCDNLDPRVRVYSIGATIGGGTLS